MLFVIDDYCINVGDEVEWRVWIFNINVIVVIVFVLICGGDIRLVYNNIVNVGINFLMGYIWNFCIVCVFMVFWIDCLYWDLVKIS